MTSLSPADAERLKLAFQRCRDMEGTLNEQLRAYAKAGREIFPAYGDAVDRLVERLAGNGGGENVCGLGSAISGAELFMVLLLLFSFSIAFGGSIRTLGLFVAG